MLLTAVLLAVSTASADPILIEAPFRATSELFVVNGLPTYPQLPQMARRTVRDHRNGMNATYEQVSLTFLVSAQGCLTTIPNRDSMIHVRAEASDFEAKNQFLTIGATRVCPRPEVMSLRITDAQLDHRDRVISEQDFSRQCRPGTSCVLRRTVTETTATIRLLPASAQDRLGGVLRVSKELTLSRDAQNRQSSVERILDLSYRVERLP